MVILQYKKYLLLKKKKSMKSDNNIELEIIIIMIMYYSYQALTRDLSRARQITLTSLVWLTDYTQCII